MAVLFIFAVIKEFYLKAVRSKGHTITTTTWTGRRSAMQCNMVGWDIKAICLGIPHCFFNAINGRVLRIWTFNKHVGVIKLYTDDHMRSKDLFYCVHRSAGYSVRFFTKLLNVIIVKFICQRLSTSYRALHRQVALTYMKRKQCCFCSNKMNVIYIHGERVVGGRYKMSVRFSDE